MTPPPNDATAGPRADGSGRKAAHDREALRPAGHRDLDHAIARGAALERDAFDDAFEADGLDAWPANGGDLGGFGWHGMA